MEKLKDKVIVITGASGGIGFDVSKRLISLGAKLVLLGGKNLKRLNELKSLASSLGLDCLILSGDITNLDFIKSSHQEVLKTFGKVDCLINNAGLAHNDSFLDVSEKLFDDIFALNVKAPYFITQTFLPTLKNSNSATIINIASVVGHSGYVNQSVYSASKHALIGFTKSLARETYKDGVRVHVISPGGVETDMVKLTRPDLDTSSMIKTTDIADVIEFLLTHRTNAVIDEILIHRAGKEPFSV
jgi:NADP-dependent 3-hydroxy acid dehydrogenase YdfG